MKKVQAYCSVQKATQDMIFQNNIINPQNFNFVLLNYIANHIKCWYEYAFKSFCSPVTYSTRKATNISTCVLMYMFMYRLTYMLRREVMNIPFKYLVHMKNSMDLLYCLNDLFLFKVFNKELLSL